MGEGKIICIYNFELINKFIVYEKIGLFSKYFVKLITIKLII